MNRQDDIEDELQEQAEARASLRRAVSGTLEITKDERGFVWCKADDGMLEVEQVAGWPQFLQYVCPMCGKVKLVEEK